MYRIYDKPVDMPVVIELSLDDAKTLCQILSMGHSLTRLCQELEAHLKRRAERENEGL